MICDHVCFTMLMCCHGNKKQGVKTILENCSSTNCVKYAVNMLELRVKVKDPIRETIKILIIVIGSTIASTSLPSNTNAPIWSMSIEIHGKFLLGRLLLSVGKVSNTVTARIIKGAIVLKLD